MDVFTVCGGEISTSTYGTINSPGYPGHYPVRRDCMWSLSAPLGKRIQMTFATLQLEHHQNCSYDFLEVRTVESTVDFNPTFNKRSWGNIHADSRRVGSDR